MPNPLPPIPTTPKALIQAMLKGAGTGKPKPKS